MNTLLNLIRKWNKQLSGCYDQLDKMKAAKGCIEEITWPDYCVLPLEAAVAYLNSENIPIIQATELTACWLWRQNKVIFRFDEDLVETLAAQAEDTGETDILPAEFLLHPPYPAVYIQARNLIEGRDGFFYFVDYDTEAKRAEIRVLWGS